MKNIIKTLLVVMVLVLAITAFTGCELLCTHEGTTELIPSIIPTCTEAGMTLGSRCTACEKVILEPKVWEALGHEMTEGSCTEAPVCTRESCDYTGELLEHQMEAVEAKEPGCEKVPGHNAHTACKVCGYSEDKEVLTVEGHTWGEPFVYAPATCTEAGLLAVQCTSCGGLAAYAEIPAGHDYDENGVCKVEECGHVYVAYYLIGYINGANVGCEDDHATLPADYMFVDGQLVVTFTADSYVFVKSANYAGESKDWFMSAAYEQGTTATLANTSTGTSEKMFVPGGVELTFTLTVNEDGTLTLSYTTPAVEEGGADVEEGGAED